MAKKTSKTTAAKPKKLVCCECSGPLDVEDYGELGTALVCRPCGVRVAGPFIDGNDFPDYVAVEDAWNPKS